MAAAEERVMRGDPGVWRVNGVTPLWGGGVRQAPGRREINDAAAAAAP